MTSAASGLNRTRGAGVAHPPIRRAVRTTNAGRRLPVSMLRVHRKPRATRTVTVLAKMPAHRPLLGRRFTLRRETARSGDSTLSRIVVLARDRSGGAGVRGLTVGAVRQTHPRRAEHVDGLAAVPAPV